MRRYGTGHQPRFAQDPLALKNRFFSFAYDTVKAKYGEQYELDRLDTVARLLRL